MPSPCRDAVTAINGHASTNQTIHRGTYFGQVVLKPHNKSQQLTDQDVQKEIKRQIADGVLPARDKNTLYMIYFPSNITINLDGALSCQSFGAYHFEHNDNRLARKTNIRLQRLRKRRQVQHQRHLDVKQRQLDGYAVLPQQHARLQHGKLYQPVTPKARGQMVPRSGLAGVKKRLQASGPGQVQLLRAIFFACFAGRCRAHDVR